MSLERYPPTPRYRGLHGAPPLTEMKAQAVLIKKLHHQLAFRFGASSERADRLQLALETNGLLPPQRSRRCECPSPSRRSVRGAAPDPVPRMEVSISPGKGCCAGCSGALVRVGEDTASF